MEESIEMKKIIELLETELSAAFEKAGYDKKYAKVTLSNRPDLCEYQCNRALAAAQEYRLYWEISITRSTIKHLSWEITAGCCFLLMALLQI